MSVSYILLVLVVKYFCVTEAGGPWPFAVNPVCEPPRGDVCVDLPKCKYFAELMDRTPIPRPRYVIQEIIAFQCGFNPDMSPKVCCTRPLPQFSGFSAKSEKDKNSKNVNLLPRNCGLIPMAARITQGTETTLMEFPWMALLVYETSDGLDFHCAGTLINERYVLTAAHCVVNYNIVGVRIGEHDIRTTTDCDEITGICSPPVQDFIAENIIVHPEFTKKTLANDIALIRLATSANLTYENVKPVCLPLGEHAKAPLDGELAVVTGWGVKETGQKSEQLLKIRIPIVDTDDCRNIYKNRSPITNKQLCAGGKLDGKDSCGGDSGGPLMISTADGDGELKFVQHGIVSFGPRYCGTKGQPGIYTKVGSYVEWILENMEPWNDES